MEFRWSGTLVWSEPGYPALSGEPVVFVTGPPPDRGGSSVAPHLPPMSDVPAPPTAPARASGRAAFLVGTGVFLSRISGLIREQVLAAFVGIGIAADAFKAALQIPGLLQNVLGEGVLSASFVPVYAELNEAETEEARREADEVAGTIATLLGC